MLGLYLAMASTPFQPQANRYPDPRSDLVLKAPIERWDEGIPLGNGMMGLLLWGGGNKINVSLDRGDLWDQRTPDTLKDPGWTYANMQKLVAAKNHAELVRLFDAPYDNIPYPTKLPAGRVELELQEDFQASQFGLDLSNGLGRVDGGAVGSLTAFVCAGEPVAILAVPCPGSARLIPPAGVASLGYAQAKWGAEGALQWYVQEAAQGFKYCVMLGAVAEGNAGMLVATIATSAESKDPVALARKRVEAGLKEGYFKRLEASETWWRKFWATSSVQIPDPKLQKHYDFVKYLYGAGSRKGSPPMPLQGVWTADEGGLPPWKGDYHNDLNTQMTYLAYHSAGLRESGEAWLDFLWKLLPEFKRFAKSFYGVEGAVVPGVMTLDGKPMGGWGMYSLSPTNGAWVAQSFYLHWRTTMDHKFLKERAYPWCKEIGTALMGLLKPDKNGELKLPLSSSPEIHDNSLAAWLKPNSNYDQALMMWLFEALASMAEELKLSTEADGWHRAAAGLGGFDHDSDGSLTFARGEPFNESHRHFSHAMAIHPLGIFSADDPKGKAIVNGTIDDILKQGTAWWCGYSFSWMACMLAQAHRAEEALKYLKDYERAFILRNGFHANGDQTKSGLSNFTYRPFTLEGNFLAMQAVQLMLLQSDGGTVNVFPAVAKEWQDCEFHDLRAEGGFKVSAKRQHGITVWVKVEYAPVGQTLQSASSGTLTLRDPFGGQSPTWNRKDVKLDGPDYEVTLKKGQVLEGRASPEDPRLLFPNPHDQTRPRLQRRI